MSIQFTCPHCGVQTDVAEEYAGQSGPCAACGETITVPPLAGTPGYRRSTKGWQGPIVIILVAVVIVAVLLLCGGLPLLFLGFRGVAVPPPVPVAAPMPVAEVPAGTSCAGNLRRIGVAMQAYHQQYGCFPPAHIADEDGKPMHSWRVLLLPFLGQQALYDEYDFEEPWNGPNNQMVADTVISMYRCPTNAGSDAFETNYVMIVGPGAISDGTGTSSVSDMGDSPADVIVVFEVAASAINWMEPRDLNADEISFRTNESIQQMRPSNHQGFIYVLAADGSVQTVNTTTSPASIRAMTAVPGREDAADAGDSR